MSSPPTVTLQDSISQRPSLDSMAPTIASDDDYDDVGAYWDDADWIPLQKNGKQRSPNMIRNELQRYMDNTPGITKVALCNTFCVSSNSLNKFMNPKTYKDPWSAVQNESYWAAARFLEKERNKPKPKVSNKRKAAETIEVGKITKKSKSSLREDARALMDRIASYPVPNVSEDIVYDSCQDVIKKIKTFLGQDGVTKADFLAALGGINSNSLNTFLASKKQDRAGNVSYRRAWVFFEKKRLMEGTPKTIARIKHELEHPDGFSFNASAIKWYIVPVN